MLYFQKAGDMICIGCQCPPRKEKNITMQSSRLACPGLHLSCHTYMMASMLDASSSCGLTSTL